MTSGPRGMRASARLVAEHLSSLVRLQRELARAELEQKGATAGTGAALALAAVLLVLYGVGFGLAALAAALALVVAWWLALLIVFVLLLLFAMALVLVSRALFRETGSFRPEQAMEEARLTKQVMRNFRAG